MKKLLSELCMLDGVSGYEEEVREYIEKKVKKHSDEMFTDSIGNLFVLKKGAKRRKRPLMVCAHMDEVGFLVDRITDDGMVKLTPVGGIDPRVLVGRRMKVGYKKTKGIISLKAIHLTTPAEREQAAPLSSLYVDVGAASKAETEALTAIGEPVVFDSEFLEFGDNCVKAKAIDDRVGCAVMIKIIEKELPYDTWFVFTTNEEIGCRGARVAAQRLNPGLALIIEGTTAADLPGVAEYTRSCAHRGGAVVSVMDGGAVYPRELRERILGLADKEGIKWQYRQSMNGSTDAGTVQSIADGALVFGLAAPVRYIHCATNVVHIPDALEVLKMAQLFVEKVGDANV